LLVLIKDYPISILSINTIQNLNESTIVALNMLNGMYYCYKNEPKKATLFFETAIKQECDENQIYHLHIKNTQVLLKNAKFKEV
jgi:hypothetical protein